MKPLMGDLSGKKKPNHNQFWSRPTLFLLTGAKSCCILILYNFCWAVTATTSTKVLDQIMTQQTPISKYGEVLHSIINQLAY